MARKATGQVVERDRRRGRTYALRFRAYGERRFLTLGRADEGWTRQKAEVELENVLADVRRGIWQPPEPAVEEPRAKPTFHEFSSEWYATNKVEWRENTQLDYEWRLTEHLLPFFARHKLSAITVEEVDRYRAVKLAEGRLSPTSINKTITRLAQILEVAVEYGYIERNPAKGRRRRVKASKPQRSWLDRVDQIAALLEASGELDAEAKRDPQPQRRVMIATLVFAGLRIGEMLALRWRVWILRAVA
jgi:integrase